MRLLRVQVPDFRALKNVDISFEPEFTPQVFPLGSLNGGGKSTLLQLIFVLLHCSAHKERHEFIANMLKRVTVPEGENCKLLASFELQDGEDAIELEFLLCNDDYLRQLDIDPIFNKETVSFEIFHKQKELLSSLESEKQKLNMGFSDLVHDGEVVVTAHEQYEAAQIDLGQTSQTLSSIQPLIKNITDNLAAKKQLHITTYFYNKNAIGLICSYLINDKTQILIQHFLAKLSKQVFLSAPPTQVYLFLNDWEKKSLFKKSNIKKSVFVNKYESILDSAKKTLPHFLTFDVFAIDIVISFIENARNQDFKTSIETGGYGTIYKKIISELNQLTQGKNVFPEFDENNAIIGIVFRNNENIDIYTEDLSHGELKRLSIYIWLKSMPKGENIVFIDEIENAFHPDWQRHIVDDLVEWAPSNQFILATHSYELCRGVTPAHVKELSPNLFS